MAQFFRVHSISPIIFVFLRLVILQQASAIGGRAIRSAFHQNDLRESKYHLTTCKGENTTCGFLQANAKGVNQMELCSCPSTEEGYSTCPMTWDSEDGHSITMGSDQYKFCGQAPKLTQCDPDQIAYTGRLIYSTKDTNLISYQDEMHCYCPESHKYVLVNQDWEQEQGMIKFSYTCVPLPYCRFGETCKVVTENGTEFLVDRKCQCGWGFNCPTVGNRGGKIHHTELGRVDTLKCQR